MSAEEYRFDEEPGKENSAIGGLGKFIWNSETKEFCGRDGSSWAKVSLFYAVFYTCLAGFFVGMLSVFMAQMPLDKPTYFGHDSTMAQKGPLNPGLGFRPQIDVEDHMIAYSPATYDAPNTGFKTYVDNLRIFLNKYYKDEKDASKVIKCEDGKKYTEELASGNSCDFDYKHIFNSTQCTENSEFGFKTNKPCVLVKLNKIISWEPKVAEGGKVLIECQGETSVDKDNIIKFTYHSENNLNSDKAGEIDPKYFPYYKQSEYRSPFVFVEAEVQPNVLVNIECIAKAINIDFHRAERRGMTKFSLYVTNKKA